MTESPRRARSRATRAAVLRAAAEEFAAAGYQAASLTRVVERSGVTKGGLYFHFASKRAMALALLERMGEACHALADDARASTGDPLRTAASLARLVQDVLAEDLEVLAGQRLAQEGVGGPGWTAFTTLLWQDVFTDLFTRAHGQGLLHPCTDPAGLGRHVVDISGGAFRSSVTASGLADLAERVRLNWELLLVAVATPAWLEAWRADGGMAAVLGQHLDAPGSAAAPPTASTDGPVG